MKRSVSLAAGTVLDVDPPTAVSVASESGFDAVGLWFDPQTWNDTVAATVRRRLDETAMTALDIEPVMLQGQRDSGDWNDYGDRIVDAAMIVGARHILVASRDCDSSRVASRLNALAERLGDEPIMLVLEFLPVLGIRTLDEAAKIVAEVDHPKVGVLIDSLHLARAGHVPIEAKLVPPAKLPYLQICDAPAQLSDATLPTLLNEALHGRLLPGAGNLPIAELLAVVPNVALSLELRSKALMAAYHEPLDRARAVRASIERYL